ncbi:MAG TPA: metalloregulator ArsR/SmtB family transcription factor [Cyclobacteriaceae bacterium]|nr:metalloregulator ArsR/SmtB family transcription factor [Cyclobacteriaceae bacterium]HMV07469.1 metalloregulator ArsR/SmtB family transcription factor [Cyclobacteriaceae bacterium]HMW99176.1 metalloregulator ArsR/SmtB family transcription factor [Cyclobacteriaceae bacterium]HMX48191.1 metalloregulator ArsR/SmtB family transcription factor [Cyclobacteriaceae bacterium]HMY94996.1 metalloregulator ArsR/SmtB family transcription factor [Cyclobacteriaceae bacterium]
MKNTCIRVFADVNQIKACKEKISHVDKGAEHLANSLSLAGNGVRLKILFLLQEEGQLCVCDLSDILGMNISAISQHLRKLKDGKIILSKKTGQTVFYSVSPEYTNIFRPIFKLITDNKILELI